MREVIIKNAAECTVCHELIESKHVHDFRSCKCGRIAVDGGREYLRRLWNGPESLIDRSVVEYHPASQWLTGRLTNVLTEDDGRPMHLAISDVLSYSFSWTLMSDIMNALRELPFVKAMSYDDLQLLEKTIRKELTGKE